MIQAVGSGSRRWLRGALLVALAAWLVPAMGCRQVLQYTDELVDPDTGRTWFVRAPANLGSVVGFVVSLPVDVVALPVTGTLYYLEDARTDGNADLLSFLLFPSVVLWKTGALLATPFDAVEFAVWRSWSDPGALNAQERERVELRRDDDALPRYPVTPIFPAAGDPVGY